MEKFRGAPVFHSILPKGDEFTHPYRYQSIVFGFETLPELDAQLNRMGSYGWRTIHIHWGESTKQSPEKVLVTVTFEKQVQYGEPE